MLTLKKRRVKLHVSWQHNKRQMHSHGRTINEDISFSIVLSLHMIFNEHEYAVWFAWIVPINIQRRIHNTNATHVQPTFHKMNPQILQ